METLKRTELIYFIVRQAEKYGWDRPLLVSASSLKIPKDNSTSVTVSFDHSKQQTSKAYSSLISANFVNATLVSHLDRYRGKKLFRKEWKQALCVLTNVGILAYDEPDDKRPSSLVPIIDTTLTEIEANMYQKKFVFSLRSFSEEIVFAALTQ